MDVNVHEIIVLRDKKVQARTHKKKRINKKWAKRYGFKTYENQLPFLFSETANTAQKERGIRND